MSKDIENSFFEMRKSIGEWVNKVFEDGCNSKLSDEFSFHIKKEGISFWRKNSSSVGFLSCPVGVECDSDFGGSLSIFCDGIERTIDDIGVMKLRLVENRDDVEVRAVWRQRNCFFDDDPSNIDFIGLKIQKGANVSYVRTGEFLRGFYVGDQHNDNSMKLPDIINDDMEIFGVCIKKEIDFNLEASRIIDESGIEDFCREIGVWEE
ncbi:hypothetical protein ACFL08_02230 [Patescibacteria group bacterium]